MDQEHGLHWPVNSGFVQAPTVKSAMAFNADSGVKLSPENHTKLINHLMHMLHRNSEARQMRNADMMITENDLLGAVIPTGTDCQRAINRAALRDVSVPDSIYPHGWMSIQRFVSDLMELIFPVEAPYAVAASIDNQPKVQAFVKAFRHQGVQFNHRGNLQAAIFDAVALDFGALEFKWSTRHSAVTQTSIAMTGISSPEDIHGMEIRQLDPYNVCYDESVPMPDLAAEGEFCAYFDIVTPFRLERARQHGQNFLSRDIMQLVKSRCFMPDNGLTTLDPEAAPLRNWFYFQPAIAQRRSEVINQWGTNRGDSNGQRAQTSFSSLFSGPQNNRFSGNLIHKTTMYARVQPSRFGLVPPLARADAENEPFQIWEFHIIGEGYLAYAAPVASKADMLPVAIGGMNFRRTRERSLNIGHHYAQMSLLISTILNLYKRSMRKGLEGGLTIYNADVMDLADVDESWSGRVPVRMRSFDQDLRKHVMQLSELPDYSTTLNDAQRMMEIMNSLLPINAQPAMAGLDRATTYQAQAVMATAMRGLIYYATGLDGTFMVPARFFMHHLNMLNAADLTYVDEATAGLITVSAQDVNNTVFELVQSQPLMGIDRLRIENILREMLTIVIQSGGQLSPLQAAIVKHWFSVSSVNLSQDDYEKAVAEEVARAQQAAATSQATAEAQLARAQTPR